MTRPLVRVRPPVAVSPGLPTPPGLNYFQNANFWTAKFRRDLRLSGGGRGGVTSVSTCTAVRHNFCPVQRSPVGFACCSPEPRWQATAAPPSLAGPAVAGKDVVGRPDHVLPGNCWSRRGGTPVGAVGCTAKTLHGDAPGPRRSTNGDGPRARANTTMDHEHERIMGPRSMSVLSIAAPVPLIVGPLAAAANGPAVKGAGAFFDGTSGGPPLVGPVRFSAARREPTAAPACGVVGVSGGRVVEGRAGPRSSSAFVRRESPGVLSSYANGRFHDPSNCGRGPSRGLTNVGLGAQTMSYSILPPCMGAVIRPLSPLLGGEGGLPLHRGAGGF